MTSFLSNASCAALGERVWEYRDYEVSLYNPNVIGDALHNLPRVTDTNFSRFEYEVEEDDYWIGVGVAVAFAFLVGLFTFTIISLQTVFKVLNQFAQSAWTASMLLLETCCPCCTGKDVKDRRNSSVEHSFENKRQTMRCSCIWGTRLDTEHRLTLFSSMCAVALGLVGLGIMVVAFAGTVDGYDSGLDDADSLKSTFNSIADSLEKLEVDLKLLGTEADSLQRECPLWNYTGPLTKEQLNDLVDELDDLDDVFRDIADYINSGEDVLKDYEDGTYYAIPSMIFIDLLLLVSLVIQVSYWAVISNVDLRSKIKAEHPEFTHQVIEVASTLVKGSPNLLKGFILLLSWTALGLIMVGAIFGADYCDEADENTIRFSYTEALNFDASEDTALLVRDIVRYYIYCPKPDDSEAQTDEDTKTGMWFIEPQVATIEQIGENVDNLWSNMTAALTRLDETCDGASTEYAGCCTTVAMKETAREIREDVCMLLAEMYCPPINYVYHDLMGDSVCDSIFTEGFGWIAFGLMMLNICLLILSLVYSEAITSEETVGLTNQAAYEPVAVHSGKDANGSGSFGTFPL